MTILKELHDAQSDMEVIDGHIQTLIASVVRLGHQLHDPHTDLGVLFASIRRLKVGLERAVNVGAT
jgi:hypothetical protein